jgi:CHAD domain-containing protein
MADREKEAKLLAVSEEQFAAIGALSTLADQPLVRSGERVQEDRYLDTDDFRLHRAGLSLRTRTTDGRTTLTLKEVPGPRERPALADREEVEEALPTSPFDLAHLPDGAIARRIAPLLPARPLHAVAWLRTRRETFRLGLPGGPLAEVALDRVEILPEDGALASPIASFYEVEVEDLVAGADLALRAAEALQALHGLLPSPLSKLERALAARGLLARARGEERTFETTLQPGDRFVDAAHRILRKHFEKMKANEPGTRLGEDAEFLHDMRVSTRRMRAALRTFGPAFAERTIAGHDAALRRIARVLGDVRDLDVYLERLPEYESLLPPGEAGALAPFAAWLEHRRRQARARMLRYLDSRGHEGFLARFERFLDRGSAKRPKRAAAREPVVLAAPRRVRKALDRVLKKGRSIPAKDPPPEDLHRLRIRVKRLRYACEFFADLYGPTMARFVRSTVALQDLLGAHQDACVAGDVLRGFAAGLPAGRKESVRTAMALGRLIAAQELAAAHAREGFRKTFQRFDRRKARRRMWQLAGPFRHARARARAAVNAPRRAP